ncbi:EAL domain-containing protein [Caldimonas tepidiphila]|uniref:EAL domain-containing response regulator n=1 Tax=Caldimonas tepidiphila TaxID=2315841 RepID=UPI001300678C|nr:EAL domain-containing response regulator [Caldimonas tepidiphila]
MSEPPRARDSHLHALPGSSGKPAGSGPGRGRRVWLLLDDTQQAAQLEAALAAEGWQVEVSLSGMYRLLALMHSGRQPPELLVCGLRFFDGDAFRLIRHLAALPQRPVLYFTSRQQRSMFKSAAAMAAACGVQVAGFAEKPVAAQEVAAALRGVRRTGAARVPAPRPPAAELSRSDLLAMLTPARLQAWVQPKMRLSSHEVVGFESLMRGIDDEGRIVSPDRLVPALSRHGLLDEATLAMARHSVDFVAGCLDEGMPVSGAINASLQSLSDPLFCSELSRTVQRTGLDPSWITIEITETDAMADLSTVIENTSRIRLLGFNLAIDDFGTGYSSLFQLSQVPFSELKVEGTFVSCMESDPTKQLIVGACTHLAAGLGLKAVAEGVETRAELEAVRAAGCTEVQGYLVAQPMPVPVAHAWLHSLDGLRVPLDGAPDAR